jgi:hypothetical protein
MFYHIARFKLLPLLLACSAVTTTQAFSTDYRADEGDKLNFLLKNTSKATNLPLSFHIPENYWEQIDSKPSNEENRNERILATYGQNIYDAATWQIALAMLGHTELASEQTLRLMNQKSGNLEIRASAKNFKYGDKQLQFDSKGAFLFRMISDEWGNIDPMTGKVVGWMDWKPILGENAWAAFIGPLQVAYFKYKGRIPLDCSEMKLALNMLPAIKAMQSPIGGVYHATWGVWGKDPHDISSENNASLYAGLTMLKEVLQSHNDKSETLATVNNLLEGIEKFFREYAYDQKKGILLQGGIYDPVKNTFKPSHDFAVDVQTWGITVLGVEKIDSWFGEKTAYNIWQKTKQMGGFHQDNKLLGVGYTNAPSAVLSVEWTLGAILLVNQLESHYQLPELAKEAAAMREGIETLKEKVVLDGVETVAYDYADKRYHIPFGWWSNKIPSLTSTAWVIMIDRNFNPFVLGGGAKAILN